MNPAPSSFNQPTGPDASGLLDDGIAASQSGDSDRAVELFGSALALAPDWHLPAFLLGSEHASRGDFEQAEAYIAQAVLLAPDFHIARYQLGLLQFSGGRTQIAMLTWAPLRSLPAEEQPFAHLVQGFSALARGDLDGARRHLEAGLPLATTNQGLESDVRRVLAVLREQTGDNPADAMAPTVAPAPAHQSQPSHVLLANYAGGTLH